MVERSQCLAAALALILAAGALAAVGDDGTDFATERLARLVEREARLHTQLRENPELLGPEEIKRRVGDLVQAYQAFLADNPDDVQALILYGKLLRRAGEDEAAFDAFLKTDELEPRIAVVKQQIGTYLAEQGRPVEALAFHLHAIELEPETAAYHFGLGQLLTGFRDEFVDQEVFTDDAIDREMIKAFRTAARLGPDNFDFQMRLGEAYYDLTNPDWKNALLHWNRLRQDAFDSLRVEIIDLHRARVLGELGRYGEARKLAETVEEPALQFSRDQVLEFLSTH